MGTPLRLILGLFSLGFLCYVFMLVGKGKLLLKYSLLWLVLGFAMLACAVFPGIVFAVSGVTGIITSSNFVFLVAISLLLAVSLSLSVVISRQSVSIKNLVQRVALLEKLIEDTYR